MACARAQLACTTTSYLQPASHGKLCTKVQLFTKVVKKTRGLIFMSKYAKWGLGTGRDLTSEKGTWAMAGI